MKKNVFSTQMSNVSNDITANQILNIFKAIQNLDSRSLNVISNIIYNEFNRTKLSIIKGGKKE